MAEFKIRRAAVLGAGVMGSKIAAHLANVGIPSYLLDLAPAELTEEDRRRGLTPDSPVVRNRLVEAGWKAALNAKPPVLFSPELASLVTTGNFSDNLEWVRKVDWIVEAVTEKLEIKRSLLEQVERHWKPGIVVSSNTSGIPIHKIVEGFSAEFRRHFLGTHFFNPPRYMKLLEIIPTQDTDPALVSFVSRFGEGALGKGVVLCKDTPGFIANRIGIYGFCFLLKAMMEAELTVQEVDLLTGPALGRPRSATFRTLDVVGLDTVVHVARNLYDRLADDTEREVFHLPPFIDAMLEKRWLGDKTGQGFYKKVRTKTGSEIQHLDYKTLEYRPSEKPGFIALQKAQKFKSLEKQIRAAVSSSDRGGTLLWKALSASLCYAAFRIPEISDDIISVDNAMKWGFVHQLGPFETWDALGVKSVVDRLQEEGRPIPSLVEGLLAAGKKTFYKSRAGRTYYYAAADQPESKEPEEPALAGIVRMWTYKPDQSYSKESDRPGLILLRSIKDRRKTVLQNPGASLLDLGDGIACLVFHTKMNAIDANAIQMVHEATGEVGRNFAGMIIANEGEDFSVGANLYEVLAAARAGQWEAIEGAIRNFQQANMRLRYSEKPVVAAPHNRTLGGGCEIAIHCDQVHAAAELYIGFVEVAVGLIPGAGGCKEMVVRAADDAASDSDMELFPRIRKAFELIATARVSASALEARHLGILRERDHFTIDREQRIQHAKGDVQALVREGYHAPLPRHDIPVLGQPGQASLKLGLHIMERAGYITEYDKVVGTQLATVLTGGAFLGVRKVSEQYLLDLEREAFLSLCGQPKTQERMEYMLKEGKPLRN